MENKEQNYRVDESIRLQIVCYNYTPKYFEITLVASNIISLIFSSIL
jgi:hypothetical protein